MYPQSFSYFSSCMFSYRDTPKGDFLFVLDVIRRKLLQNGNIFILNTEKNFISNLFIKDMRSQISSLFRIPKAYASRMTALGLFRLAKP